MKKWQCQICGYVYDEALGAPEDGLPPGTRWQDIDDDWMCPVCGTSKRDFVMTEIETETR
jgi:rubredoxin